MSNSRGLPSYDKSVALQVTEQPNPEGAASMLINSFRNFSETAQAFTQGITKEVAQQQRETLKNNISNTYRGFALEALKNPDQNAALVDYNAKSKEYAQGILKQADMFNKPYVSNLIDYYHNEHQYSIEKNAITQNKRALSVEAYQQLNDATRDWMDAINSSKPMVDENGEDHQFDTSRALLTDQLRNMEIKAKQGNLDPAVMGKARDELIKKYQTQEYLKRYQDAVEQGLGNQFIANMRKPDFHIPGFSETDKYNVINQMIKIRDQGLRGAHVAIGQLHQQMADNLVNVENGGMDNVDLHNNLQALDPMKAAEYKDQTEIASSKYTAKQATMFKSPEQVADYKKQLYDIDYDKPDAPKLRRIADASSKAIDQQRIEMRRDPLTYVMQNPAIQNAVNDYEQAVNANAVGSPHKYTPLNTQVPRPWDSVIQEQMHLGFTVNGKQENSIRLINPARVNTMVNQAMQADPVDKVIWMNRLNDEFGGGLPFKLALKQLVNAGLPRNFALLASIDPNSPDAGKIAESVSIPAAEVHKQLAASNKNVPAFISKQTLNDVFNLQTGGTNNFKAFIGTIPQYSDQINLQFKRDMASDIIQIANYYALTQGMQGQEAVSKAEDIIANRYNYTSIANNPIRLPKDVSAESVKSFANQMQADLFKFNFNLEGADKMRAQRAIKYGHWANDSVDDGLVWVDSNGKMWTDANGHPYSFSFDEAKVGMKRINLPVTKKTMYPVTQEDVDTGTSMLDTQEADIDRIGQEKIDYIQKHGSSYTRLMQSINKDKK